MKFVVGIYFLIGVLLSPLIYSNNGGKFTHRGAYGFGQTMGASLIFWPSYVFAWEPEIEGKSDAEFSQSIVKMLKWRQDKWFSTKAPHTEAMLNAIGICILLDSGIGDNKNNISNLYKKFFKDEVGSTSEVVKLREITRKRFDGMDYKDVLEEGLDCRNKLSK